MKVKIQRKKDGSFIGSDGASVEYYWYKAIRLSDGVTIEFGSRNGGYEAEEEVVVDLEKYERTNGKFGYKEIV